MQGCFFSFRYGVLIFKKWAKMSTNTLLCNFKKMKTNSSIRLLMRMGLIIKSTLHWPQVPLLHKISSGPICYFLRYPVNKQWDSASSVEVTRRNMLQTDLLSGHLAKCWYFVEKRGVFVSELENISETRTHHVSKRNISVAHAPFIGLSPKPNSNLSVYPLCICGSPTVFTVKFNHPMEK